MAFALPLPVRSHSLPHRRPRRPGPATCTTTSPVPNQPLPPSVASTSLLSARVHVQIVGVVHGSATSASDATITIATTRPRALVLELCPSRLASLTRAMNNPSSSSSTRSAARPRSTFAHLSKTLGGRGPAAVAAALDAVYRLQRRAGVDPGVEFKAALHAAAELNRGDGRGGGCRVVCGDADASDTVRALAGAVAPRRVVRAVRFALGLLARPPVGGVSVAGVLAAGWGARVREVGRVFVPFTAGIYAVSAVAAAAAEGGWGVVVGAGGGGAWWVGVAGQVARAGMFGSLLLASLCFVYVLIDKRDRVLAMAIRETAEEVLREAEDGRGLVVAGEPPAVVAVVGLLHCNGIVRYLNAGESW